MGMVRAIKRLFGLLCLALAALLGLFALFGFFVDDTTGSRTIAVFIGSLALVVLVIGLRCLRRRNAVTRAGPRQEAAPEPRSQVDAIRAGGAFVELSAADANLVRITRRAMEDVQAEWEDSASIEDDNAPWRPWMRKGRLYRAIREGRYIRVAYQKKEGEEATTRILWPKKITKGRLRADDLTPGKTPGSELFIVDRITYVELLPKEWTRMELGRSSEASD